MEIKQEVSYFKTIGYKCDVCGKICNDGEYATLFAMWQTTDKNKDHLAHICEDCYDKVKIHIESLGGKIQVLD